MTSRVTVTLQAVSGATYDEPLTGDVWVSHTNTWSRPLDPIFHRIEPSTLHTVSEGHLERRCRQVLTRCGALVHITTWLHAPAGPSQDYRDQDHGLSLPIRWAVQFARPCRRCWP